LYYLTCIVLTNLVGFVEEEAEVGENHPQFLPTVAGLELSQQVPTQLILKQVKSSQFYSKFNRSACSEKNDVK
jgi:hypothetical protein